MNRTLLISLGAVAAAVLLFVFVVSPLLFSDDDAHPGSVATPQTDDGAPSADGTDDPLDGLPDDPESETAPDEDAPAPVPETFEVFTARDPFQQLVVDETADASAEPVGHPDGSDDDRVDSDDDDGPADDHEPSDDASIDGTTVRLEEVFEDDGSRRAQVTVNDRGYDVAEGDEFASRLRLLDLSERCATLLYGDQRFTLCEGETIRK